MVGSFGLIPHWSKDATIARRTYNARSETVHEKPSYREARGDWHGTASFLLKQSTNLTGAREKPFLPASPAPMESPWVLQDYGQPGPAGELTHSFTMLTINADSHPLMRHFHKPDDEKRMVVILNKEDYDAWLLAPAAESRDFLRQFPADNLQAEQPQSSLL